MALQSSKIHLRSITIIGAGAAVLAVIGYLLMKSDSRKKLKKKVLEQQKSFNENTVNSEKNDESGISMSIKEVNETDEINKLCDLYSKKAFKLSKSPPPPSETIITKPYIHNNNNHNNSLNNDEANISHPVMPSILNQHINNINKEVIIKNEQNFNEYTTNSNISQECCSVECKNNNNNNNNYNTEKENLLNLGELNQTSDLERNKLMNSVGKISKAAKNSNEQELLKGMDIVNDKLSETSSDSGNGTSEINIVHSPHEVENECNIENNLINNNDNKINDSDNSNILQESSNDSITSNSNTDNDNSNDNNNDNNNSNKNNESKVNDSLINNNEIKSKLPQSSSSMSISSDIDIIVYEFHFPRKYCGKLIGRNGVHVDYIRNKTHVQIAVRNDPNVDDLQIVCLTGCISDVDQALDIISARFPFRHYPQISFKPITKPIVYRRNRVENNKILVSSSMYVQLTSLKTCQTDVNVSAIVTPTHLFIQLPSQPTYQLLQRLDEDMLHLYTTSDKTIPNLTCPIEYGTICAAPTSYGWHRAMVTDYYIQKESQQIYPYYNGENEMATVKFLDYGGYLNIPVNELKQLRTDFMSLPFQAIEVFLDGITIIEGAEENGKNLISKLIKNSPLKAIISGYNEDNFPLIKLYVASQKGFLINNELVAQGWARNINN